MKKSKAINLVLVAGLVGACSTQKPNEGNSTSRLWVRGDSTSQYSHAPHTGGGGYFHFIPFGFYHPHLGYTRGGYESSGFSSKATSSHGISRGGFGHSGARVGS